MKKKLLARAFMFLALANVVTFLCVSAARAASPGGGASANKLVRSGNLFYSTVKVIVKPVTGKRYGTGCQEQLDNRHQRSLYYQRFF
ncbi:MAG: hypothetical protein V4577_13385 [Bacteroidota bacterium]